MVGQGADITLLYITLARYEMLCGLDTVQWQKSTMCEYSRYAELCNIL
jgi:hypothetical protein